MTTGRHYIISENPKKGLEEKVKRYYSDPIEYEEDQISNVEIVCVSNYSDAIAVYQKIREKEFSNGKNENYWYYIVLDQKGYEEFKILRNDQKFKLLDIKSHEEEEIRIDKLEYINLGINGGALKGKKMFYETALNFWISAVNKIIKDNNHLDVDLHGGTYNPISLETLETLCANSCANLSLFINKGEFVSSIEVDNGSHSGTFFIETIDEYFLLDVYCP